MGVHTPDLVPPDVFRNPRCLGPLPAAGPAVRPPASVACRFPACPPGRLVPATTAPGPAWCSSSCTRTALARPLQWSVGPATAFGRPYCSTPGTAVHEGPLGDRLSRRRFTPSVFLLPGDNYIDVSPSNAFCPDTNKSTNDKNKAYGDAPCNQERREPQGPPECAGTSPPKDSGDLSDRTRAHTSGRARKLGPSSVYRLSRQCILLA